MTTPMPHEGDAQDVAAVVRAHLTPLRAVRLGRQFTLQGRRFRLVRADRNVVYRVHGRHDWFVKMPVNPASTAISREAAGIAAAASLGDVTPGLCAQPYAIDLRAAFIVARALAARPLSRMLYRAALSPLIPGRRHALRVFAQLGRSLGLLHGLPLDGTVPPASRQTEVTFSRRLHALSSSEPLLAHAEAVLTSAPTAHRHTFVHGNFRPDNILVSQSLVHLIDFENCGLGSPCEDLHILCAHCVLIDRLLPRTGRGAVELATSFLRGYGDCRPYDTHQLARFMTMMVAGLYIDSCTLAARPRRVAGIPFREASLRAVLRDALDNLGDGLPITAFLGLRLPNSERLHRPE